MRARLTVWLPKLGFGALVGACALVPAIFTRQTAEAFMVPKVTVLWIALVLASVGLAAWALAARRWPIPRAKVWWPFGALVGWTIIATIWSTSPITSFVGQYGRYDGLLGVVAGALVVALVVAYTWRTPRRLEVLVLGQLAGAVLCLGYVVVQQLGWDWIQWYNESQLPIERPYGLLGNSNFSGAHLAMCIPAALGLGLRARHRWQQAACWAFAALLALGVWWTGTRGGMVATVAGVAAAGALVPRIAPRVVRWGALAITAVGLVAILAISVSISPNDRAGEVAGPTAKDRVLSRSTLVDRREIWAAGLRMVRDHPLVGVGPDAFGLHMADYRRADLVATQPLNADEAHDVLIDRAATAGIPALVAYLWLVVVVAAAAWRGRRRLDPDHHWLLAACGGSLAAYLAQGLFSIDVVPLALVAWTAIGGIVVLCDPLVVHRREELDHQPPVALRPLPLSASVGLIALAVALVALAVRPFAADLRFRDGLVANAQGRPGLDAATEFHAATTWYGAEPRYHERLGQQLVTVAATGTDSRTVRVRLLREAVAAYDHALATAPGEPRALRLKASALALLGVADPAHRDRHLADARAIYDDLSERIPGDPGIWVELGRVAELQSRGGGRGASADRRAGDRAFRRALALDDSIVDAVVGRARLARDAGDLDLSLRLLRRARQLAGRDEGIARLQEQVQAEADARRSATDRATAPAGG